MLDNSADFAAFLSKHGVEPKHGQSKEFLGPMPPFTFLRCQNRSKKPGLGRSRVQV